MGTFMGFTKIISNFQTKNVGESKRLLEIVETIVLWQ